MPGHFLALMMMMGNVFQVIAGTALAMPALLLLALIAGRRGHAASCLWGAARLARAGFALAAAGCVYFWFYYSLVFGIEPGPPAAAAEALRAGLWLAVGLWLAGVGCTWLILKRSETFPVPAAPDADSGISLEKGAPPAEARLELGDLQPVPWLCLAAVLLFIGAMFSLGGIFAAPPQGMEADTYIRTLARSALHAAFSDISLAGGAALALLWMLRDRPQLADEATFCAAARWCAIWACVGFFPGVIDHWGDLILTATHGADVRITPAAVLRSAAFFRTLMLAFWMAPLCVPRLARSAWAVLTPWPIALIVAPLAGVMM